MGELLVVVVVLAIILPLAVISETLLLIFFAKATGVSIVLLTKLFPEFSLFVVLVTKG